MLFLSPKQQTNINHYSPRRLVQRSRRLLVHWLSLSRSFPLFSKHVYFFELTLLVSQHRIFFSPCNHFWQRGFVFDYLLAPIVLFRDSLLPRPQNGHEPRREKRQSLSFPAWVQAHFEGDARWSPGTGLQLLRMALSGVSLSALSLHPSNLCSTTFYFLFPCSFFSLAFFFNQQFARIYDYPGTTPWYLS